MRSNVCVSLDIGLGLDILGLIIVAITLRVAKTYATYPMRHVHEMQITDERLLELQLGDPRLVS